jgi:hypothetical protein
MTVYSPVGKNTGAAVVVLPGGGYWILAIDLEGTEVLVSTRQLRPLSWLCKRVGNVLDRKNAIIE